MVTSAGFAGFGRYQSGESRERGSLRRKHLARPPQHAFPFDDSQQHSARPLRLSQHDVGVAAAAGNRAPPAAVARKMRHPAGRMATAARQRQAPRANVATRAPPAPAPAYEHFPAGTLPLALFESAQSDGRPCPALRPGHAPDCERRFPRCRRAPSVNCGGDQSTRRNSCTQIWRGRRSTVWPAPRQLVKLATALFDRTVHGRQLLNITAELRQHRLHLRLASGQRHRVGPQTFPSAS